MAIESYFSKTPKKNPQGLLMTSKTQLHTIYLRSVSIKFCENIGCAISATV